MTDEFGWPLQLLSALRLGQRLAVEVPAADPGRRAFVDITPSAVDADTHARREGWTHRSTARSFTLQHREYDADLIDGFDYDIGSKLLRRSEAPDESALLAVLHDWRMRPSDFSYAWDTADPT